ncbi:MAG: ABC transporter permease [Planctomycetes bacterium]|nr:ABC transporter permease [Planctomycetota bacterium]
MTQTRALLLVITCLLLTLAIWAPEFFAPGNLQILALSHLPLLIAATAMTLLITAGQIDVAIGAEVALCAVVAGIAARAGLPIPIWIGAALLTGVLIGFAHGMLVTKLRIPALVTTLATLAILRGALRLATGGVWIQQLPASFQWCGLGQAAGQLIYMAIAAAVCTLVFIVMRQTKVGREVFATGCDPETARLLGARPERVVPGVFIASGLLAGLAALLDQTRLPSVAIEAGTGLELAAIACVVLGGASIRGGRGSVGGTALGVLFFAAISGLVFLHVDPVWERAIQGAILLIAIAREARPKLHKAASGHA